MKTREWLIIVDYQKDFGNPKGTLYVKESELLVPYINKVIEDFQKKAWLIITTQDWHPKKHFSFATKFWVDPFTPVNWDVKWPDHCVQNTWWADFVDWLNVKPVQFRIYKWYAIDRDFYTWFWGNEFVEWKPARNLEQILVDNNIKIITILWLATDFCVKYTVLDALNKWFWVNVLTKWIRAVNVNPGDWDKAIEEMKQKGAIIL